MPYSPQRGYDYLEVRHSPDRNHGRRLQPLDSYPAQRRQDPYSIEGNPRGPYRERLYSDPIPSPRQGYKRHGSLSPIRRGPPISNGIDNPPRRHGLRPVWMYDKYDREQLRPKSNSNHDSYRSRRPHDLEDSDDDGDDNRYGKYINVTSIDVFAKENALRHHTYVYDTVHIREGLVLRRGQSFDLGVRFNRGFNFKRNKLRFLFTSGKFPQPDRGTSCQCILGEKSSSGWSAQVKKMISRDQFTVSIFIPPNCVVSNWKLSIETIVMHYGKPKSYFLDYSQDIFILFNPWCTDDDVYFPNRDLLDEYIYNDSGAIFHGTCKQIGAKPWFFGQFEDGIIDACMYCVHRGFNFQLRKEMSDPIRVSRIISEVVNGDNQSVLLGSWNTTNSGGVSPMNWGGSPSILKQYLKTGQSVRYGQCIAFSGVVTTICRAIGIPCRSVTNFLSAHDTDGSVQIDFYWDLDNREGLAGIGDAIWNYHCWNDVWMRRRDLPPNYGGWQAIDATPLIRSSGKFEIGPTSLHAIKSGKRDLQYDGAIGYAEINADKINWVRRKIDNRWVILTTEREAIGKRISTKRPDGRPVKGSFINVDNIRQDITNQYKNSTVGIQDSFPPRSNQQDVVFGGFRIKDSMVGSDFDIDIAVRNMSTDLRTLDGKFICEAATYTGERLTLVKQESFRQALSPGRDIDVQTVVKSGDYLSKLTDQLCIKVSVIIRVLETGQTHAWQDDYRLRRPDIRIEVMTNDIIATRPIECRASFRNPLPTSSLTNCRLEVEGPGIEPHHNTRIRDIPPGEYWSGFINLTPHKTGRRQITATLSSNQLQDISGSAEIDVR